MLLAFAFPAKSTFFWAKGRLHARHRRENAYTAIAYAGKRTVEMTTAW
jgi:hypothetical protein